MKNNEDILAKMLAIVAFTLLVFVLGMFFGFYLIEQQDKELKIKKVQIPDYVEPTISLKYKK